MHLQKEHDNVRRFGRKRRDRCNALADWRQLAVNLATRRSDPPPSRSNNLPRGASAARSSSFSFLSLGRRVITSTHPLAFRPHGCTHDTRRTSHLGCQVNTRASARFSTARTHARTRRTHARTTRVALHMLSFFICIKQPPPAAQAPARCERTPACDSNRI